MQRDCGKGKLIPVKYKLLWNICKSDTEHYKNIQSPFSQDFEAILKTLPPLSNIGLYACDKEGYCNCILSSYVNAEGYVINITNRLDELTN